MTFRIPKPTDCGIYAIKSPSGKLYIGSSKNIPKRWSEHKRQLVKGTHHSPALQHSFNKYSSNLEFHKLLVCTEDMLTTYEQQYLDFYKPAYNVSKTADRPSGMARTQEFKDKVSAFQKGNTWNLGRKQSPEHIEAVRQTLIGNKRAVGKGKPLTEERKLQISNQLKGHGVSEETRKKIGEASRRMWASKKVSHGG